RTESRPGRAQALRLAAGKRRVLGQRSEEQKGIAGWQHDVLSDFPHGELHRFRIALDVVCAQHRNPNADRLRFLSQTGLDGARPGSKLSLLGGVLRARPWLDTP